MAGNGFHSGQMTNIVIAKQCTTSFNGPGIRAVLFSSCSSFDLRAIVHLTMSLHALMKKSLFLPLKACHTSAQYVPQLIFPSWLSSVLLLKFCQSFPKCVYFTNGRWSECALNAFDSPSVAPKGVRNGTQRIDLREVTSCRPCDGNKKGKSKTSQC